MTNALCEDAVQSHQQFFGGGSGNEQANSGSMGSAAAIQALKMYTGGQSGNSQSGNSQNAFIGMAMAQGTQKLLGIESFVLNFPD